MSRHGNGGNGVVVTGPSSDRRVTGISALTFLGPIVVFVVAVIAVLLVALLNRSGFDGDQGDPTLKIYEPPAESSPLSPSQRQRTSAAAFIRPLR